MLTDEKSDQGVHTNILKHQYDFLIIHLTSLTLAETISAPRWFQETRKVFASAPMLYLVTHWSLELRWYCNSSWKISNENVKLKLLYEYGGFNVEVFALMSILSWINTNFLFASPPWYHTTTIRCPFLAYAHAQLAYAEIPRGSSSRFGGLSVGHWAVISSVV